MGVLDGVRVIELAEHGFVPSCGAVLGDWGAEVIKIERPTGDPLRAVMPAGLVADTLEEVLALPEPDPHELLTDVVASTGG